MFWFFSTRIFIFCRLVCGLFLANGFIDRALVFRILILILRLVFASYPLLSSSLLPNYLVPTTQLSPHFTPKPRKPFHPTRPNISNPSSSPPQKKTRSLNIPQSSSPSPSPYTPPSPHSYTPATAGVLYNSHSCLGGCCWSIRAWWCRRVRYLRSGIGAARVAVACGVCRPVGSRRALARFAIDGLSGKGAYHDEALVDYKKFKGEKEDGNY